MQAIHSSGKKVLIYLSDGGFCAGLEDCNNRSLIAVVSFKRSCLSTSIVGAVRDPRKAPTVQPRAKESWREEEASGASVQTPTPTMTTSRCTSTRAAVTTSQVDRPSHLHLVSGTRAASPATGGLFFHGKHIVTSVLQDLVATFGINRAEAVVLAGSGSGAR